MTAAMLALVLGLASPADDRHCEGWPEWDAAYLEVQNFDMPGAIARNFFEVAGCVIDDDNWPNCPSNVPCYRDEVTIDISPPQEEGELPAPGSGQQQQQQQQVNISVQGAQDADAGTDALDLALSGDVGPASRLAVLCASRSEVGRSVDCRLRVPGRIQDVDSVDWRVHPSDGGGCAVTEVSNRATVEYSFTPRCTGDYRVEARAYDIGDREIGRAGGGVTVTLVPDRAGEPRPKRHWLKSPWTWIAAGGGVAAAALLGLFSHSASAAGDVSP